MRKLLLFLFLVTAFNCTAQIAVKVFQFRPTGEQGFAIERKFSAEIMYMNNFGDEDDKWRSRFGISYMALKPRLDTFPVFATMTDGSGSYVLPGYEVYHKYNMGYIFCGADYKVFETGNFVFYPGLDVIAGAISRNYDSHYETLSDGSDNVGNIFGGLRIRAGVTYNLTDRAGVFLEAERAYYLADEMGGLSHNDIGLGFLYSFNY
jgi:hypothetical protein